VASEDKGDDLREEIQELREMRAELDERLTEFHRRLEEVERKAGYSDEPKETDDTVVSEADISEGAETRKTERKEDSESFSERVTLDEGFEINVGLKWMGRVGALAVTLGVAFFIIYAIQEDLIGYTTRIALGVLFGVVLVAVGDRFFDREGYRVWSMISIGAGIGIAYFSVYASWGFEDYREAMGMTPTLNIVLLTLVIVGALALSVYRETWVIGAEAFVLGYTTAFLVPEPGVVPLFYVFLLSLMSVGFAWQMDWNWARLGVVGILGSYGVFVWWADATDAEPLSVAYGFLVAYGVVFVAYSFVCERRHKGVDEMKIAAINGLNAFFFYLLFHTVTQDRFEEFVGVATLAVAGVYLALAFVARDRDLRGNMVSSTVVAWSLTLLSAWIQFDDGHVTVVWAVIALVLTAVAYTNVSKYMYTVAYATAVVTATKAVFVDFELPTEGTGLVEILATRPAAYLTAAFACYTAYVLLRETQPEDVFNPAPTSWLGTAVLTVLFGLELTGFRVSVVWTVFGLVLLLIGIGVKERDLRLQGLALFGLATAKVFLIDTAGLDFLGRTVSFIVLGVILLLASFIYSKYREEVRDWVEA